LTVAPDSDAPTDIFPETATVYSWDPGSKSYSVPDGVVAERSYWVAVATDATVTVFGTPVTEWNYGLTAGWNMIGSVHGAPVPVTDLHDDPSESVLRDAIYWWNPETKSYVPVTHIEPGKGYWIATTDACDLAIIAPT
jgi:hypothetical protein